MLRHTAVLSSLRPPPTSTREPGPGLRPRLGTHGASSSRDTSIGDVSIDTML